VQHKLSSESTPVLSGAIPTFESFMMKWEIISRDSPHLVQFINKVLILRTNIISRWTAPAHILLPCVGHLLSNLGLLTIVNLVINPSVCLWWIRKHWDEEYIIDAKRKIRELVRYILIIQHKPSSCYY
jgi:hypothetical protein